MSAERGDGTDLRERVTGFLSRNFPQIQMHGGSAVIEDLDPERGEITLRLAGACSGCGISPMTVQAIKSRMASEIPEIETVHANTGETGQATSGTASRSQPTADERDDPPF
ncbi:MAG: NifU family protein [Halanaeroarchaeum sp.]